MEKVETIKLNNPDLFESLNGLWKGKKPPFTKAKVIRNTNFTKMGIIDYSNIAELDVEQKQLDKRHLNRGDIIVERSGGSPAQPVGRVVFFDKDDKDFSFSNFTSTIRIKDQKNLFPKYVFYFLKYFYDQGSTEDLQQRTTGLRNLDFNTYKERAEIPFLPFVQQHTIAAILSKIQEAIENQDKIIQTTTVLKASLMKKIFTEGLNGAKVTSRKLGDVLKLNYGKGLPEKQRSVGKIPVYGSNGVVGCHNQALVDNAGIIVGRKGSVGKVHYSSSAFYPIDTTYYVTQSDTDADLKFLYYLLDYIRLEKIKGDVGVPGLNREMAYLEQIPYISDLAVQKEIAAMLTLVDKKIEVTNKINSGKTDLFKSMLGKLMSGEIRVSNITI